MTRSFSKTIQIKRDLETGRYHCGSIRDDGSHSITEGPQIMKSWFTRSVLVGMVLLALGSCSKPSTPPGTAEAAASYVSGDYKIGPEDVVEVIIWRNADLSKVVTVRP